MAHGHVKPKSSGAQSSRFMIGSQDCYDTPSSSPRRRQKSHFGQKLSKPCCLSILTHPSLPIITYLQMTSRQSIQLTKSQLTLKPIVIDNKDNKYNADAIAYSWFDQLVRNHAAKLPRGEEMLKATFEPPANDPAVKARINELQILTRNFIQPVGGTTEWRAGERQNQANNLEVLAQMEKAYDQAIRDAETSQTRPVRSFRSQKNTLATQHWTSSARSSNRKTFPT